MQSGAANPHGGSNSAGCGVVPLQPLWVDTCRRWSVRQCLLWHLDCPKPAIPVSARTGRNVAAAGASFAAYGAAAASAEASTTLTAIAIGTNQCSSFARRTDSQPADLGQDLGRRRWSVFLNRGLDDREQLPLQRPMMPLGPLAQSLNHPIRHVLDG